MVVREGGGADPWTRWIMGAGPLVDLHPWPDAHDRREKEDQLDGEGAGAAAGT